ncbi:MAG: S8 family serine peptidase [Bacteroidota bacterium]
MNPKALLIYLLLFLASPSLVEAQELFYVFLDEKESADTFDPYSYFDEKALERRIRERIPLFDERDLPLKESYKRCLTELGVELRHDLRWFNAISIKAWPDQAEQIAHLAFVKRIEAIEGAFYPSKEEKLLAGKLDTLLSLNRDQVKFDQLEKAGLNGNGVRVAIFDTGFKGANKHEAFEHLRAKNKIKDIWNFYDQNDEVYSHDDHGTQVLSSIAGKFGKRNLGAAPEAEFLLARTEHKSKEKAIEEDHWLAAVEWADKKGADIINSSLTYTSKRYEYADMDGKKTLASRAAKIASDKGMLVVVSMGNDGGNKWKYLGAPADVPEVLSVAASMSMMPTRLKFSSFGPNAKGQTKPDIAAPGFVVVADGKGKYSISAGTSFSSPMVVGFAACLMQRNPEASRKEIWEEVRQSGHYFPYYDYELGYGVIQASKLFAQDSLIQNTFSVDERSDSVFVAFNPELMQDSTNFPFGRLLYVHLENDAKKLEASFQEVIENRAKYFYFIRDPEFEGMLRIWFAGYLWEERVGKVE